MNKKKNASKKSAESGKIVAVTLAVVTGFTAVGYALYRICRHLLDFFDECDLDEIEDETDDERG